MARKDESPAPHGGRAFKTLSFGGKERRNDRAEAQYGQPRRCGRSAATPAAGNCRCYGGGAHPTWRGLADHVAETAGALAAALSGPPTPPGSDIVLGICSRVRGRP